MSSFGQGDWITFPISVAAGGSVSITVANDNFSTNAVLSGIFLGGSGSSGGGSGGSSAGAPMRSKRAAGQLGRRLGYAGYDLAAWNGSSDLVSMPSGVSVSLLQGARYQWASATGDVRALGGPTQSGREAATWYDPHEIELQLSFTNAYSGNLALYAVDWESAGRQETITVDGQSATVSDFGQGDWITFPITVPAGGSVSITVANDNFSTNAVLSGIFLGGSGSSSGGSGGSSAGAPMQSSAPQGNWVGAWGTQGYDLAAWNGSSDLVSMPSGVSVSLLQGARYQWASATGDVRALEGPTQSGREAATWYDPHEIELQLSFTNAYSGNLALYAVDWESAGRQETITVDGQSATVSDFGQGDWITFPITVPAGGSVSITVANDNFSTIAVLAGSFLNRAPTVTSRSPVAAVEGATNGPITINGTGFESGATASFSNPGITVNSTSFVSARQVTANISVSSTAAAGATNVTLSNPDGTSATGAGIFTVSATVRLRHQLPGGPVSEYAIGATTGLLSSIGSTNAGGGIAVTPDGKYAYTGDGGEYSIDATGLLTSIGATNIADAFAGASRSRPTADMCTPPPTTSAPAKCWSTRSVRPGCCRRSAPAMSPPAATRAASRSRPTAATCTSPTGSPTPYRRTRSAWAGCCRRSAVIWGASRRSSRSRPTAATCTSPARVACRSTRSARAGDCRRSARSTPAASTASRSPPTAAT